MGKRVWPVMALIAIIIIAVVGGPRYRAYVHGYTGTLHNPASLEGDLPGYFYLDWRANWTDLDELRAELGEDGVRGSDRDIVVDGRLRHDPLKVIQTSLILHDQLLDEPTAEREEIFRRQVEWVAGEGLLLLPGDIPVWPQYYTFERYGLERRWVSALTQGQAISLLVRAAILLGEPRYANLAGRAAEAFLQAGLPIVWRGPDGEIFLEEYPCDPPSHVLNGCLFAWLGLWDFVRYSGHDELHLFCMEAIADIRETLPRYHLGDWTRYDVHQTWPTSPSYQEIHAALARTLGEMLDDPIWREQATRWRGAADDPWLRSRVFIEVLIAKLRAHVFGPGDRPRGNLLDSAKAGLE